MAKFRLSCGFLIFVAASLVHAEPLWIWGEVKQTVRLPRLMVWLRLIHIRCLENCPSPFFMYLYIFVHVYTSFVIYNYTVMDWVHASSAPRLSTIIFRLKNMKNVQKYLKIYQDFVAMSRTLKVHQPKPYHQPWQPNRVPRDPGRYPRGIPWWYPPAEVPPFLFLFPLSASTEMVDCNK